MNKILEKIRALLGKDSKFREPILYLIFGALTTLVNWAVFFLVTGIFGLSSMERGSAAFVVLSNAGQMLAWILSVVFAYVTNKKFVFESKKEDKAGTWKEFGLFVSARVASLLIFDLALFNICLLLGMNVNADKLLMNVLVVIFNYVASKFVIFKRKEKA